VPETDEERLSRLEERLDYYDGVIGRLIQLARIQPKGQIILKVLGLQ
jgi:hypothetical protein